MLQGVTIYPQTFLAHVLMKRQALFSLLFLWSNMFKTTKKHEEDRLRIGPPFDVSGNHIYYFKDLVKGHCYWDVDC